ncbi:M13 family metallopeptidase [Solitalea koreensis]|nr:M13 family metallopeptidase [Solitalea koreensis]
MKLIKPFLLGVAGISVTTLAFKQLPTRKFIDASNMDTSVSPGDNFYLYANGGWLKKNPIPASETRWGSFNELIKHNNDELQNLLQQASKSKAAMGTDEQKVGDFYTSGMDSLSIEKAGMKPISADLARIAAIKDSKGILNEVAFEHSQGNSPLFNFFVYQDDKNSSEVISQLSQGGLGLPDRDYYFKDDDRTKNIRAEYVKYLSAMFSLIGDDAAKAQANANAVMKLETALASASMTRVELRDPNKVYHKMTIAELNAITPAINWNDLLPRMMVNGVNNVLVRQPNFYKEVNKQLSATSLADWKAYLRWNTAKNAAPFLSSSFVSENFNFYGKVLTGQKMMKPRKERVATVIDGSMGEVLGKLYVDKNFKPEAKARMMQLIENLSQTYEQRIKRLDWMSETTKDKAIAKLHAFIRKIGYPDKWKDYSSVQTSRSSYYKNVQECNRFDYNYMIHKLGKPVDKTEWGMTPPTVNAYYNPVVNEIVFPAGILQFPFFDFEADDAINYGGIGGVIGHEMTHGFDDEGRQYDAQGNLKDWWTAEDATNFNARAKMVVDQFNGYSVLNGTTHVNGQLTLGENLADLGGINIAYEAFKKTKQGQSNEKIDGFTPDQRFFLSWAQVWRANIRDEAQAQRIVTDPHSPGMYRCNGPLSNMPEFYAAFGVKEGDKMWKPEAQRAKVW